MTVSTQHTLIDAIGRVLHTGHAAVSLHEPCFVGNEWSLIKDCLDTGWVSSVGKYVDEFESRLCRFTGATYAVAVVNGTAALHVALQLAGTRAGDEVLVPSLTFIGTANAVSYCGAIAHFVDSEEVTLGVDPIKLESYLADIVEMRDEVCFNRATGRPIRALVPMHTFGHPVRMRELSSVADRYRLAVVEDAAESLGSLYRGRHTGTLGVCGVLSFNGNKIITTGGGGAILTNDERIARAAKHVTTTARVAHAWSFIHDEVGYNYRLPNINAALGCAQMDSLNRFIDQKRLLAHAYRDALSHVKGARMVMEPAECRSNYWLNTLLLDESEAGGRDDLLGALNSRGIMARPAWTPMHRLPMYRDMPRMDLSMADSLERRLINLPSSAQLAGAHAQA